MLRIQLSDLNQTFREHRRYIGATFYIGGMSVIITSVEHRRGEDFSNDEKVDISMI